MKMISILEIDFSKRHQDTT